MEHIYTSIDIENELYNIFPPTVVECMRKYLKLAIDLNGYTNKQLREFIYDQKMNNEINKYVSKKYGKSRSCVSKLKKYQMIHVIQHYNFNIPLLRFPIDIFKEPYDNSFENVEWTDDTMTLYFVEKDKRIDEKSPPTVISLNDVNSIQLRYNNYLHKYHFIVDQITKNHIYCIFFQEKLYNNGLHASMPEFCLIKVNHLFFSFLFSNDYGENVKTIYKYIEDNKRRASEYDIENKIKNIQKYSTFFHKCKKCGMKFTLEIYFKGAKRRSSGTSLVEINRLENLLADNFERNPSIVYDIWQQVF
tara:strand:- start:1353 stop:2264 length:912 start_codon:yes stop_codon:yes gene_type:complete